MKNDSEKLLSQLFTRIVKSQEASVSDLIVQGLTEFAKIPVDHLWMLTVEGHRYSKQNGPAIVEEKESGYVVGILSALCYGILTISEKITVEKILKFHELCFSAVKSENVTPGKIRETLLVEVVCGQLASRAGALSILSMTNPIPGCMLCPAESSQTAGVKSQVTLNNKEWVYADNKNSVAGQYRLKKILEAIQKSDETYFVFYPPNESPDDETTLSEYLARLLNEAIQRYYQALSKAKGQEQIKQALAGFIQESSRIGLFKYGYYRVLVNCVLQILLIQQGMTPAIFYNDPNIFSYHTSEELSKVIDRGIKNTQKIIANPNGKIFLFSNNDLNPVLKEKFSQVSTQLMKLVEGQIKKLKQQQSVVDPSESLNSLVK